MKKQAIAAVLSITALILVSCTTPPKSEIGFIDTVKILQESKLGQEGMARLEVLQSGAIKQLEGLEKKRSAAEKAKKTELATQISAEMQAVAYELQNTLQQKQEAIFTLITQELTIIVEEYREANGLTVIFNHSDVISFDPKADITSSIMEIFNTKIINFDTPANVQETVEIIEEIK